jgi:hypothetical protein
MLSAAIGLIVRRSAPTSQFRSKVRSGLFRRAGAGGKGRCGGGGGEARQGLSRPVPRRISFAAAAMYKLFTALR